MASVFFRPGHTVFGIFKLAGIFRRQRLKNRDMIVCRTEPAYFKVDTMQFIKLSYLSLILSACVMLGHGSLAVASSLPMPLTVNEPGSVLMVDGKDKDAGVDMCSGMKESCLPRVSTLVS
jgi:hypothetical protein